MSENTTSQDTAAKGARRAALDARRAAHGVGVSGEAAPAVLDRAAALLAPLPEEFPGAYAVILYRFPDEQ